MLDWKRKIVQISWLLLGVGTIVLFSAAMVKKNNKPCRDVKIEITGADEHLFIDEKDVRQLIDSEENIINKSMNEIDLRKIETDLEKIAWVKNAELFFDNTQALQVRIEERQPIARVFTVEGSSFYLDSGGVRLPLSNKLSARVPMFTNFPSDKMILDSADSVLQRSVVEMGRYISEDSFWSAQIAQIDIAAQGKFELVPTVGDQLIVFGDANDIDRKFKKLLAFYKQAWLQNGINTYQKLDLQYTNQIVAVRRGARNEMTDSTKAKAAINALMNGNLVVAADTTRMVGGFKMDSILAIRPLLIKDEKKRQKKLKN